LRSILPGFMGLHLQDTAVLIRAFGSMSTLPENAFDQ